MIVWRKNIPVAVNPTFWLLAGLIAWLSSNTVVGFVQWVAVVFISVLVHELGHALVAKWWGQTVSIELGTLGGLTTFHGPSLSRKKEFFVVLSGPLFGFLLCILSFYLYRWNLFGPLSLSFLSMMTLANLFWSILNLIPVHPLDGGKLMGIALEGIFGQRGMRASYFLSGLFAILGSALFLVIGHLFAGALLLLCAFESFRSWKVARFYRTTASENVIEALEKAEFDWQHSQPERAISRLEEILQAEKPSEAVDRAREMLAGFFVASGQNQKAFSLLFPYKNSLSSRPLKLFQLVAYKLGNWQLALEAGKKAFLEEQDVSCAIMNAFSSAHLGNVTNALNWLAFVKKSKLVDMKSILQANDFDGIRSQEAFSRFSVDNA